MNEKKGFLCLARQVGQSIIIGDDLEVTLIKVEGQRAKVKIGESVFSVGRNDGISLAGGVYLALDRLIFDGAVLVINAPKHIRVDRKEIRERIDAGIPPPEKLAESHLERQKRIN